MCLRGRYVLKRGHIGLQDGQQILNLTTDVISDEQMN